VVLRSSWDDLVLQKDRVAKLREICNHARYRGLVLDEWGFERKLSGGKGLSLLFAGPPGTGKTMAAGVMARELGLDLYSIDLSNVVNKYIGETEKQLAKIFDEAERSNAVLFFDEADALFGKRTEVKDAHDRYANIETSYLLQRMEAYQGVAILATNLAQNMDDAFVRRLHFIVDFTVPDERERLRIWQRIWPDGVPRDADVDLGIIARRFELSGGNIRNVALAASFLAAADGTPVGQRHLIHATRREYQKMGRIIDERLFSQKA
jgi:SpoVK/Ycf46/Vps4 family AAA+-type ATPase